jgi:hypothetical protein
MNRKILKKIKLHEFSIMLIIIEKYIKNIRSESHCSGVG